MKLTYSSVTVAILRVLSETVKEKIMKLLILGLMTLKVSNRPSYVD